MRLNAYLVFLPSTLAFQFPFKLPDLFSSNSLTTPPPTDSLVSNVSRIAIVGAGAGGSSAAFWISKAQERFGLEVEIDVYETNGYVGGRECFVSTNDYVSSDVVTMQEAPPYIRITTPPFQNLN
jgi:prenylcysteine oxidase/farnesylcysteine lyase